MLRLLKYLFLDKRARAAITAPAPSTAPVARLARPAAPPPRERTPAQALAEAEARMVRLPPEKAQLVRAAMAVHRASQSSLAGLSDDERKRLREAAEKAFLGGGKSG